VFPEVESPSLVPEEIDEETPLPAADTEMTPLAEKPALVERVTVSEHFIVVDYVPARPPERRARSREPVLELVA
jgi:hypothetical protein